jgi:Flp pilus assembly protein protease CpaA
MTEQHDVKTMADGAAVVVGLGGFMGWMTPVVTLIGGVLTIVWLALRIWETDTVKNLVAKYAKHE